MHLSKVGLTLIEVIIGLFLFSFGILSVSQMLIGSLDCSAKATRSMYNSAAAGDKLEDLSISAYEADWLLDKDNGFNPVNPDHGPFPIPHTASTIEWEVEDDFPEKGVKRIAVTLRWLGKSDEPRSFSYVYLKSNQSNPKGI